ncbi:MAG: PEP-CTERM sorting domain-containing protein [Thiobacillus sp.]|nr:PEP-CTERM sorting domain-containing protein [Thiobacillus sp.]
MNGKPDGSESIHNHGCLYDKCLFHPGEQTIMHKLLASFILATTAFPVFAITVAPSPIPEPNALWLLGIGAVAGLVVRAKNRNNKKK